MRSKSESVADQMISEYEGVGRNLSYSHYIARKHKQDHWQMHSDNALEYCE